MSELHVATSGALVRELVKDVLAEMDAWSTTAASQGAGIGRDKLEAAEFAIRDVRTNVDDHLGIRLGVTLATFGISPEGTPEGR